MKKPFLDPCLLPVLAGVMAGTPVAPVLAQEPPLPLRGTPLAQGGVPISLGVSKYDYFARPERFPEPHQSLSSQFVDPGVLTNSPRLEQLIQDGKLPLSLQDAIALALENSMDIVVQRYNPWMADVSLLKTQCRRIRLWHARQHLRGLDCQPPLCCYYDPFITQVIGFTTTATTPINNPFISGTGLRSAVRTRLRNRSSRHTRSYNTHVSAKLRHRHVFQRGLGQHPRILRLRPTSSILTCNPR